MSWPEAPERPAVRDPHAPPARRLSGSARWAWGVQMVFAWIVFAAVATPVAHAIDLPGTILYLGSLALLGASLAVVPPLRYSRWRWELRDDAIDIRHGTFTVRRTLIPFIRVQHVDTKRGITEQMFDLSTVIIHTAAGHHTIPYLSETDGDELRDRLVALTRADA
jgi:uncharacterized protein